MSDYNVLSDILHTFQSLNDGIKLAILLIPPCFLLCAFGLFLRHRATIRAIDAGYMEHVRLPVQDVFDRVEHLRSTTIPSDDTEETTSIPMVTVRRSE